MNGTEFFEFVQEKMNEHVDIVEDDYVNWSILSDIDEISVTLTEYRRLYTLFKSFGVNVDNEDFICSFICDDFEMVTEWMKFHRNNRCNLDSSTLKYIHEYSKKFEMNMFDMFKFMMDDDDGKYLEGIMRHIANDCFDSVNDTDEIINGYSDGRYFTLMVRDIWDYIDGFLINFVSWSWIEDHEYVFFAEPGKILDEDDSRKIMSTLWGCKI